VPAEGSAFVKRQMERVDAIFEWLSGELAADGKTFDGSGRFSLAELSLICALDWMDFRKAYPTERAPKLLAVRAAWADRPSIAGTQPR
jgi:glutathione S-transferase